ncbi:MAG: hypothetical protein PHQ88_07345 [Bacteroides sp.]|nr:hypothetical protein [Bacteroides sp.]
MMRKLIENIESEIVDLKKIIAVWNDEGDSSALKVAMNNLAHANDWMKLLNETLEREYTKATQGTVEQVQKAQFVAQERNKAVYMDADEQEVLEKAKEELSVDDVVVSYEEKCAECSLEEGLSCEEVSSEDEVSDDLSNESIEDSIKEEGTATPISITEPCFSNKTEDDVIEEEAQRIDCLLSQSYEIQAKNRKNNGGPMEGTSILGDHLLKMEDDIYSSLSLNDIFRFSGEWFNGDSKSLKSFFNRIQEFNSLADSLTYAKRNLQVKEDSEEWEDLVVVLEKYFES